MEFINYFQLAKKYHPDVAKDKTSTEKFKEISEAYEVSFFHADRAADRCPALGDRVQILGDVSPRICSPVYRTCKYLNL